MNRLPLIISILAISATFPHLGSAQEKAPITQKKREISTSIPAIFGQNYPSLLFKYHHTPKGAFRLSLSGNSIIEKKNNSNYGNAKRDDSEAINIKPTIGYQWNKDFDKIRLFYGLDGHYGYELNKNFNADITRREARHTYGISPLMGANFFITNYLSVSAEISINVSAFKAKETYQHTNENTTNTSKGFSTRFNNLGLLNIAFHF